MSWLGRIAKSQADARSMMVGRVTDAYTNIATVKLSSHTPYPRFMNRLALFSALATPPFAALGGLAGWWSLNIFLTGSRQKTEKVNANPLHPGDEKPKPP